MFELSSIDSVLDGLKKGEMIVLLDDPGRENEGDLVMLAEYATPEAIHFMATHGRGLICMPVAKHLADRLKLEPMTQQSTDPHGTAFTVSIDLNNGSTGISAYDRSATIKHAVSEQAKSEDFIRPGHMFPLIAREGLLATRRGHTEASIALANLCGSAPAAVICEILKSDGQMARGADLKVFCETHQLKMTTIEALVAFLENAPKSYHFEPAVNLPTAHGNFQLTAFYQDNKDMPHLILHTTDLSPQNDLLHPHKNVPLVRIHSECMTGDVFGSRRCECGEQLEASMKAISEHGTGMIIYLRQEGRGIGLVEKLKAYKLQEAGYDTVNANLMLGHKADARVYGAANAALKYFGIEGVELMSGNPEKAKALEASGITIHRHVPIAVTVTDENYHYLETKAEFFKHTIVFKQPS